MEKLLLKNENETKEFGTALSRILKAGDIVALSGDLGTGKTTLARYIAKGLGVAEEVISPTFTIIREYKSGRLPLYHFDLYRLTGESGLNDLGYEEYFFGNGVSVIEWADNARGAIPEGSIFLRLSYGKSEFERELEVQGREAERLCIS